MRPETLRRRAYRRLEGQREERYAGRAIGAVLVGLILINVVAILLESVESISGRHAELFRKLELFFVALFSLEYVLRLWVCPEAPHGRFEKGLSGRLRYAVSPLAICDLLAVLPWFLSLFSGIGPSVLLVLRLLRVLKLARYTPAMASLGAVLHRERRPLVSSLVVMIILLLFASSLMYLIEGPGQPDFDSIPGAMWWGMATLTTVGYGDITPQTPLGKLLGTCIAILGIGMFALPAGILATGFAEELKKRDFIVCFKVVAAVPLFSTLKAAEIVEIASLLISRFAVPGEVIVRRDDPAGSVYFVISGELRAESEKRTFQLSAGDVFGELALLRDTRRTATVTAISSCRLLVLERSEFRRLMRDSEEIRDTVERVASKRMRELGRRE